MIGELGSVPSGPRHGRAGLSGAGKQNFRFVLQLRSQQARRVLALFIHKFFWSSLLSARAFVHSMEESPRYVFPNTVTVYNFPNHLST